MKRITVTNTDTGREIHHKVSAEKLATISGVDLAALLLPNPTPDDVTTMNVFLQHHHNGSQQLPEGME